MNQADRKVASLVGLAVRQHGLVTRGQAIELGVDKDLLARMARDGLLCREERGCYRLAWLEPAAFHRVLLVVLRTGGVISHRSAAYRHRLLRPPTGQDAVPVDVLVAADSRPRTLPGAVIRRTRYLPPTDVTELRGLPTTTVGRTLLDLADPACGVPDPALLGAVAAAVREGNGGGALADLARERLGRALGAKRLGRLLAEYTASHVDSIAEHETLTLLASAGLPAPVTGHHVFDQRGQFVAKVDFAWPDARVALEVDGYQHHSSLTAFHSDRARGNEVVLAGWLLLRVTPAQVRTSPGEVTRSVAEALAGRRWP